ncbi:GTPase domain-containing protein [Desulfonema magnum]|uniref:GTP-binding domain-containing protein n=1 Tax=Desulfonema magnum TaxID=45655 RepID=A0A975BTR9_9BACT|nr:GTPase domain-containing protein [Desulfonema magnum]QTA91624.1 GTP-binding domain-containing protein [Desulfonema magnum]
MISERQLLAIKTRGKIEGVENEIRMLSASVHAAPLWQPGIVLKKQCDEASRLTSELEARFDRKLIVSIIGPCGVGKSTLLNALAGVDELSETGHDRPTTRRLVVLCREDSDANPLREHLGDKNVKIRSSHAASSLEHVLLIDTPDTDSTAQEKHIPLVHKVIEMSDVLICVFDGENPKRRDYVDFLSSYIQRFKGESLVCVANKCDRLEEQELMSVIVPGFLSYIKAAWERPVDKLLCISARRHLHDPAWDKKAKPRHDFDQFEDLEAMIFSTFNRPGFVIDRRMENAKNLRDYVLHEVRAEAEKDREKLEEIKKRITETEKKAAKDALSALKSDETKQLLGVNVMLYQKLAQRWLGPVGWLIALWARILIFGTGIAAIFRFGNPIHQIVGIVSSFLHFKESQAAVSEVGKSERVDTAFRDYRLAIMRSWPDIAESLVKCRFDQSVRKLEDILPKSKTVNEELSAIWNEALESSIEESAQKLSGLITQFVFNIPAVGIMGYTAWITARAFFLDNYLSSDFFLHAFLTIGLVLFLGFFIFQGCVRVFAGTERISTKAFKKVKGQIEQFQPVSLNPLGDQVDAVIGLAVPNWGDENQPYSDRFLL